MPAARARVAAPWRRSCRRMGGRPAVVVRWWKWVVAWAGWRGVPSGWVKTRSVSGQVGPVARRSAGWWRRWAGGGAGVAGGGGGGGWGWGGLGGGGGGGRGGGMRG